MPGAAQKLAAIMEFLLVWVWDSWIFKNDRDK